ncbi:MAG: hypothetical protein ACYDAA_12125 [Syntrophales bacterium]
MQTAQAVDLYQVSLLSDGIRAVDVKRGDGEKAVNEMQNRGAILITTEMLMP